MPHRLPHLGRGPIAHRRAEVDEVLAPSILRPSRTKGVSKKVKFLIRIPTTPVIILAVDDFRLVRMQLQLATFQPCLNAALDGLRLLLAYAVRDDIICTSLKRHRWVRLAHPVVECEVQKDVSQQRTNHTPLRRSFLACRKGSIFQSSGCFQPPLDVQQNPPTVCVLPHCSHGKRPVEIVEEAADVKVDYPVE